MTEHLVHSDAGTRVLSSQATPQIAEALHDEVIQRLFAVGVGLTSLASSPDCRRFRDQILMYVAQLDEALQATYRISAR